jgi:hypothetical protein
VSLVEVYRDPGAAPFISFREQVQGLAAMNHPSIAILYGLNITATNARATGEEEARETTPMDNLFTRSGSFDSSQSSGEGRGS